MVHASHREKEWESPSASLIEKDPEVVPDVDIAAQVGRDFFLDEKIPRHESGQGYVKVVEHSFIYVQRNGSLKILRHPPRIGNMHGRLIKVGRS